MTVGDHYHRIGNHPKQYLDYMALIHTDAIVLGVVFAAVICIIALRLRALSRAGALGAFFVGSLTFILGGWPTTFVLLAFFVSSTLLGKLGKSRKKQFTTIEKGTQRDAFQVFANGGIATLCLPFFAIMSVFSEFGMSCEMSICLFAARISVFQFGHPIPWFAAFAGAYAAATSDTWGTEIGTLARNAPRSLFTMKRVAPGLSGGITTQGTLAEIGGATFIATIAALTAFMPGYPTHEWWERVELLLIIAFAGVAGAFVDSILGATVQELRECRTCGERCEMLVHSCGTQTALIRGVRGISNDVVNLAATLSGAAIAFTLSPQ